jgi:hypothetical protein
MGPPPPHSRMRSSSEPFRRAGFPQPPSNPAPSKRRVQAGQAPGDKARGNGPPEQGAHQANGPLDPDHTRAGQQRRRIHQARAIARWPARDPRWAGTVMNYPQPQVLAHHLVLRRRTAMTGGCEESEESRHACRRSNATAATRSARRGPPPPPAAPRPGQPAPHTTASPDAAPSTPSRDHKPDASATRRKSAGGVTGYICPAIYAYITAVCHDN